MEIFVNSFLYIQTSLIIMKLTHNFDALKNTHPTEYGMNSSQNLLTEPRKRTLKL